MILSIEAHLGFPKSKKSFHKISLVSAFEIKMPFTSYFDKDFKVELDNHQRIWLLQQSSPSRKRKMFKRNRGLSGGTSIGCLPCPKSPVRHSPSCPPYQRFCLFNWGRWDSAPSAIPVEQISNVPIWIPQFPVKNIKLEVLNNFIHKELKLGHTETFADWSPPTLFCYSKEVR